MENRSNDFSQNQHKQSKTRDFIIWALAIALMISIGYIIYQNINYKIDNSSLTIDLNDLERSREVLKQELRIIRADYDDMKRIAKSKDSTINERDISIFAKQKEIQSILNKQEVSKNELQKAKRLILSLQSDIASYKEKIAELTRENKELNYQNLALNSEKEKIINEKEKVEEDLSTTKKTFSEHEANVNSTLSISNYTIKGIVVKNSGREVESSKARRVDKVRVSFDIDANDTSVGEKTLYISVHKPNGDVGNFDGAKKGELKLRNGNVINYSDKVSIDYNKEKKTISFDWVDYEFPTGKYDIDVYENGFKIGQSTIELK